MDKLINGQILAYTTCPYKDKCELAADKVFQELQEFTRTYDISRFNTPIGVKVTAGGRIIVSYSLSQIPVACESFAAAIEHIAEWLAQNQRQCILCQQNIQHSNCIQ